MYRGQKNLEEFHPAKKLNHKIFNNLFEALKLKHPEDLTPRYLSNLSASQLLSVELTLVAISEGQEWLVEHGTSLKRKPPQTPEEMQAVKRAIGILDAYQFDVSIIRQQLAYLKNDG
ncbi:MAG: hypothetical protein RLZZ298_1240 [Pseudomonadota bacterium]|jgi:hypothetical protein